MKANDSLGSVISADNDGALTKPSSRLKKPK